MNTTSSSLNRPQERVQRICLQILPVVVAAACLWMARPQDVSTSSVHNTTTIVSPSVSMEQNSTSVKSAGEAVLTSLPTSSPRLITRPIEEIRPGMRVLTSNPDQSEDSQWLSFDDELDWRLVRYRMAKPDGSWLTLINWNVRQP